MPKANIAVVWNWGSRTVVLEFTPLDLTNRLTLWFKGFLAKPRVLPFAFVVRHVEESKSFARIMFLPLLRGDLPAFPEFHSRILTRKNKMSAC